MGDRQIGEGAQLDNNPDYQYLVLFRARAVTQVLCLADYVWKWRPKPAEAKVITLYAP